MAKEKSGLTELAKGEERLAFREGYKLPVFETEFGLLGFLLGSDLAYPEVARSLVLDGAELLCVLGSWEKADIDEWTTLIKARAYENACYVAGANRVGEDVTLTFGGESLIVGPRGKVFANLPGEEPVKAKDSDGKAETDAKKKDDKPATQPKEGYCLASIDLDAIRKHREDRQTLQNRQPPIYRAIVRKY